MTLRPIITIPDAVLRKNCVAVERVDDELNALIDDMFETMYDAPGVGLAAPQINIPIRLIVIDSAREDDPPNPLAMINPKIVEFSDDHRIYEEGCLSIPDYYAEVERPARIKAEYIDREGKPQTLSTDAFLATVIQHEIDHLDGKLFIDYLSRLKREMVIKKFKKAKRHGTKPVL